MYDILNSVVFGFHGCDRRVGEKILAGGEHLKMSTNKYDWLGSGIYFWEENFDRADEYAHELSKRSKQSKINEPFVLGAIIDLKHCLNILQGDKVKLLAVGFKYVEHTCRTDGVAMPENKPTRDRDDTPLRYLDCAVIEGVHRINELNHRRPFDSVRGVFSEGRQPYPKAGFRDRDHIQICVRNTSCIRAYFRPF
jgi:hypothetical protein